MRGSAKKEAKYAESPGCIHHARNLKKKGTRISGGGFSIAERALNSSSNKRHRWRHAEPEVRMASLGTESRGRNVKGKAGNPRRDNALKGAGKRLDGQEHIRNRAPFARTTPRK